MSHTPAHILDTQALLDRFDIPSDGQSQRGDVLLFNIEGSRIGSTPQQYSGYIMMKCTCGCAYITIGDEELELLYSYAILILPNTTFAFTKTSTSFKCSIICTCHNDLLSGLILNTDSHVSFLPMLSSHNYDMLQSLLSNPTVNDNTIVWVINAIIATTLELGKMADSEDNTVLFSLQSLLDQQHLSRAHSPHQIAKQLGMSEKELKTSIRRACGIEVQELIDNSITLRAIQMIRDGARIYEVADDLGFSNQTTFGKFFKRQTGLTPTSYKKHETD